VSSEEVTLPRNPSTCRVRSSKNVIYKKTTNGRIIRIVAPGQQVAEGSIEVAWNKLETKWKNWLYNLYIQDKKFTIRTHQEGNEYDSVSGHKETDTIGTEWTVFIDTWNEDWPITGENQKYDLVLTLRKVEAADPILTYPYSSLPHLFVVENATNAPIEPMVFLRTATQLSRPRLTMHYLNLVQNGGFERVTPTGSIDAWAHDGWSSDVIYFYGGLRCARTDTSLPLTQVFRVPPDTDITASLVHFTTALEPVTGSLSMEFLDESGAMVPGGKQEQHFPLASVEHQVYRTPAPLRTPPSARKCRIGISRISGAGSMFVDNVQVRIGGSGTPQFDSPEPVFVEFNSSLPPGDVLVYDMSRRSATLNGSASLGLSLVGGGWFHLPVGNSVIEVSAAHEDGSPQTEGSGEVILRYHETWL
jgi:hypothetical protein